SDNVVRQENIETASTVTSIIPSSTVNSDHNSTVIVTQNNQPEPISSELINLDIDQEPAIAPQAATRMVIDVIMAEANQVEKEKGHSDADNTILPSQRADTATRSLSGQIQSKQKAYNNALQYKEYHILADLWKNCMNSYLIVRKFLGHPNTRKLLNGWNPLMDKKNMCS
ncbi:hypothetical protein O181_066972, partial [Austropuccinia psidii MF-1]|nr:hypothetical protein [Austropuccinia psidii MF-1]